MALAFIGIGSNLDDPINRVRKAALALGEEPGIRLRRCSSLYRSPPMGPQDQPDFINAVALVETTLEPDALLDRLQGLETAAGRVRTRRWGERTLDLDILLIDQRTILEPRLEVPHPGMGERAFVLCPLAEIAPDAEIPGKGTARAMCGACGDHNLVRVGEPPC